MPNYKPIKVIVDPVFLAIRFCVDLVITLNLSELAYLQVELMQVPEVLKNFY